MLNCVFLPGIKIHCWQCKLLEYLSCRGTISLGKVKSKLPLDMYDFIITDVEEYIISS